MFSSHAQTKDVTSRSSGQSGHGARTTHPVQITARGRWRSPLAAIALIAIVFVAFWPSVPGDYIWEDQQVIADNHLIAGNQGLWPLWMSSDQHDYWPLSYTSLWIDWQLWGANPSASRIENILLHAVNALLVTWLAAYLKIPGPFWVGLVFGIHPVTVEAVAWIIQRKTLLAATFSLLALLTALKLRGQHPRRAAALAALLVGLGMLSKTSAVTTPVVLLALIWWQQRRLSVRDFLFVLPSLLVAFVLGCVGVWFQHFHAIAGEVVRDDGFWSRLAFAGDAVWFYLGKVLLPIHLCFVYPRHTIGQASIGEFRSDALLLCVFVVCFLQRRRWGAAPFAALGIYVISLLPVLGFVNIYFMAYSLVADHWQYSALPAIIALVIGTLAWPVERTWVRRAQVATLISVCALLLVATRDRAAIYGATDNIPLWRDTIASNPNCGMAYNNLATEFAGYQEWHAAADCLANAVRLQPGRLEVRLNLANAYLSSNDLPSAETQFREVLSHDSLVASAWVGLGKTHFQQGRLAEAAIDFQQAIDVAPRLPTGYALLGALRLKESKLAEGQALLEKSLEIDPRNANTLFNLGVVELHQNQPNRAAEHLYLAVRHSPQWVDARLKLAEALRKQGKIQAAIETYQTALAIRPDSVSTYYALGQLLADEGRLVEAISALQAAVTIDPNFKAAQDRLDEIQSRLPRSR